MKKVDNCILKEFRYLYMPEKLKTRVHNHEKHRDEYESISELERKALEFLSVDCAFVSGNEVDEDLMCLYYAIHRFMETGSREDAFDVYYCYIDSYIKNYDEARKLIEMISNFENTASNLVLKHRDHYSHSVYVFIIGLAIYHCNEKYRDVYKKTYFNNIEDKDCALRFLRFWGMTALFHDVGYPFEIPFEQVKSYFHLGKEVNNQDIPFLSYKGMDSLNNLRKAIESSTSQSEKQPEEYFNEKVRTFVGEKGVGVSEVTIAEALANHIGRRLKDRQYPGREADSKGYISDILLSKAPSPDRYNYFMDHALFSSLLVFRKLLHMIGVEEILKDAGKTNENYYSWMDAMTAIVMHNSLFKFSLREVVDENKKRVKKPLGMEEHPLAYLLMLCDELQCWDRTSYGKDSKKQLHAANCKFSFDSEGIISATYLFDADKRAVTVQEGKVTRVTSGTFEKLLKKTIEVEVEEDGEKKKKKEKVYFSQSTTFKPESEKIDTWEIQLGSKEAEECIFYKDIAEIIALNDLSNDGEKSGLKVAAGIQTDGKYRIHHFSDLKLINIFDYAKQLFERLNQIPFEADGNTLANKLSYIQLVKRMAEYLDGIGVIYTDEPKALSRKRYADFTLAEKRYLFMQEEQRQREELIQMCRGGINAEYEKYLNEHPAELAEYVREIVKEREEQQEGKDKKKENKIIFIPVEKLMEEMLHLLGEECNLYVLPGKMFFDIDYREETVINIVKALDNEEPVSYCPDVIRKKDINGRILREYQKEDFVYEEALVRDGSQSGEDDVLLLAHIKEYYRAYQLVESDDSGVSPIFWYQLGEDNDNVRLKLEFDSWEPEKMYLTYEQGIKCEIDRTMYFFDCCEDGERDYGTIYFRQCADGCIDIGSWMINKLQAMETEKGKK